MLPRSSSTAVSSFAKRGFASAASTQKAPQSNYVPPSRLFKTSRSTTGLTVTSADFGGPVARLGFAFRAGSRYETHQTLGLTHRLRNMVGHSAQMTHADMMMGTLASVGATISASTTRDMIIFNSIVNRDYTELTLTMLGEAAARPGLKAWELSDTDSFLHADNQAMHENTELFLLEQLHKAAYRNGCLGNSLHSPDYMIGKHTPKMMQDFATARLLSSECALVGVNIEHSILLEFVNDYHNLVIGGKAQPAEKCDYKGGEMRTETGGTNAYVMIAGQGAGIQDSKALANNYVLSAVLGSCSGEKFSNGQGSVAKAAAQASGGAPFGLNSLCVSHSDAGLVGLYCASPAEKMGEILRAVIKECRDIKTKGIDETQLKRAKAQAKTQILMRAECPDEVLHDLAAETLAAGTPMHSDDLAAVIDNVTANDIKQTANTVLSGKLSLAATGNLHWTPYLDEL